MFQKAITFSLAGLAGVSAQNSSEQSIWEDLEFNETKPLLGPKSSPIVTFPETGKEEYVIKFNDQECTATNATLEKIFKAKFSNGRNYFLQRFANAESRKVRAGNINQYFDHHAHDDDFEKKWQELRLETHDFVKSTQTDGMQDWSRELDLTLKDIQDLGYPVLKTIRYHEHERKSKSHWEYDFYYDPNSQAMCDALGVHFCQDNYADNDFPEIASVRFSELSKLGWRNCLAFFKVYGTRSGLQKAIKRAHFLQKQVEKVVQNKRKGQLLSVDQSSDFPEADDRNCFEYAAHMLCPKMFSKNKANKSKKHCAETNLQWYGREIRVPVNKVEEVFGRLFGSKVDFHNHMLTLSVSEMQEKWGQICAADLSKPNKKPSSWFNFSTKKN